MYKQRISNPLLIAIFQNFRCSNNELRSSFFIILLEILGTLGKDKRVSNGGNGGDFCYAPDYASFEKKYDVYDVKPGDVISWRNGASYGHVAIIEAVYRDSSGKPTKVLISEAYNKLGSGYGTYYKASNGRTYLVNNDSGKTKNSPWRIVGVDSHSDTALLCHGYNLL